MRLGCLAVLLVSMLAATGCEATRAVPPSPRAGSPAVSLAVADPIESRSEMEAVAAATPANPSAEVRMPTEWQADLSRNGNERLALATRARQEVVSRLFAAAGASFPPRDLMFRVYKQEKQLEVWSGDGESAMRRIATYGICAASGELGPKRAEGDLQVPEGFYKLGYFAPGSAWYLAALVDYPNLSDRIRGAATPGGQILMHGRCASIGCISMTDERIEEIYLMAWSAWRSGGHRTHVHIFPARDMDALLEDPELAQHHAFWREIAVGHDAFEQTKRIPTVTIERDGRYTVARAE